MRYVPIRIGHGQRTVCAHSPSIQNISLPRHKSLPLSRLPRFLLHSIPLVSSRSLPHPPQQLARLVFTVDVNRQHSTPPPTRSYPHTPDTPRASPRTLSAPRHFHTATTRITSTHNPQNTPCPTLRRTALSTKPLRHQAQATVPRTRSVPTSCNSR